MLKLLFEYGLKLLFGAKIREFVWKGGGTRDLGNGTRKAKGEVLSVISQFGSLVVSIS